MEKWIIHDISEPARYEDGYIFSYPIEYRIEFRYKILNSNLKIDSTISSLNSTYYHPYHLPPPLHPSLEPLGHPLHAGGLPHYPNKRMPYQLQCQRHLLQLLAGEVAPATEANIDHRVWFLVSSHERQRSRLARRRGRRHRGRRGCQCQRRQAQRGP